jgi:hypothetical protein
MPTEDDLRNLPTTIIEAEKIEDELEQFENRSAKRSFVFARRAVEAGARTNGLDGIFLGHTAIGSEVWAHLLDGVGGDYLCDAPHRAFVLFESLHDKRAAGDRASDDDAVVLVSALASLGEVSQWHAGIKGDDLVSRFQFLYDALVEEAEGGGN